MKTQGRMTKQMSKMMVPTGQFISLTELFIMLARHTSPAIPSQRIQNVLVKLTGKEYCKWARVDASPGDRIVPTRRHGRAPNPRDDRSCFKYGATMSANTGQGKFQVDNSKLSGFPGLYRQQ